MIALMTDEDHNVRRGLMYWSNVDKHDAYWGDIKFQAMRLRMSPDWTTVGGADANIIKLVRYIGEAKNSYWRMVRVWRCRMLLNAVYRRWTEDLHNDLVLKRVQRAMRLMDRERDKILSRRGWTENGHQWKKWNWAKTQADAEQLYQDNPGLFDTLRRNVEGKAYNDPTGTSNRMSSDPALAMLIRILRDVVFDHT